MTWALIILMFWGSLIALLFLRVPVAVALLAVNVVAAGILFGVEGSMQQVAIGIFSSLTNYAYAPVPLFIFMGEVLFRSDVANRAFAAIDKSLGKVPARQPLLGQAMGTVFGLLSGSTVANTAMLGRMLVPRMLEMGYSSRLAMGGILGAGGLAMILPPSAMTVIWGATAQVPVGPLLIAGVVPGLLLALINVIVIIYLGVFRKGAPKESHPNHLRRGRFKLLLKDVLPLGSIILSVVGLIFFGVATPTESAAIGAVASLLVAVAYRSLSRKQLWQAVMGTVRLTTMLFMIILGSQIYSQILSFTGASSGFVGWALSAPVAPLVLLVFMLLLVVVMGMFLDQVSIMLITLPLFMPLVTAQGWDPIWFGIMMLICLETGLLSPPVGMSLFVMRGVVPKNIRMADIYWASIPFVLAQMIVVALIIVAPALVQWLPRVMMQ